MDFNKVILVGRATAAPELKTTSKGTSMVAFNIATNYEYKDKEGNKKKETDFHRVVAFGKTADTLAEYLVKGQEIRIEGKQRSRDYEKDGRKIYVTENYIDDFRFGRKPAKDDAPVEAAATDVVDDIQEAPGDA